MIDHGIEVPEKRAAAKKDIYGNLYFEVKEEITVVDNEDKLYYTFSFTDDGCGIDLEKIKEICIKKGLIEKDTPIDTKALVRHIFDERFSTKDKVTSISGRGAGLSSLRQEVEKLGGSINVKTSSQQGTNLIVKIPQMIK